MPSSSLSKVKGRMTDDDPRTVTPGDLRHRADELREQEQRDITRSVGIPTTKGKKVTLERREDGVKISYTGIREAVVDLEHLRRAVAELGD